MPQPPEDLRVGAVDALPAQTLRSRRTGEVFSLSRWLTEAAGIRSFDVRHERLPPGHRASAPHRHTTKDELCYVLRGAIVAHLGDAHRRLGPDEFVVFPAGSQALHHLHNPTDAPADVLVISAGGGADAVIFGEPHRP